MTLAHPAGIPPEHRYTPSSPAPTQSPISYAAACDIVPEDLINRVQDVLPELNRLLRCYHDTRGELSEREAEREKAEWENDQVLVEKDNYIEALQHQMRKSADESSGEYSKLRSTIQELGNLRERQKDMEDTLRIFQQSNEELGQAKYELERRMRSLQSRLEKQKEEHAKERENERSENDSKTQEARDAHAQETEDARDEHEAKVRDIQNANAEERQNDRNVLANATADAIHARENQLLEEHDSMRDDWKKERQSLEDERDAMQTNHEQDLNETKSQMDSNTESKQGTEAELQSKITEVESKNNKLTIAQAEIEMKDRQIDSMADDCHATQIEVELAQTELGLRQEELNLARAALSSKDSDLEVKERELREAQEDRVEIEELLQTVLKDRDSLRSSHSTEIEGLQESHSGEVDTIRAGHHERLANATEESDKEIQSWKSKVREADNRWANERAVMEKRLSQTEEQLKNSVSEKEGLEQDRVSKEQQLENAMNEMCTTCDNLGQDRERMMKMLQNSATKCGYSTAGFAPGPLIGATA